MNEKQKLLYDLQNEYSSLVGRKNRLSAYLKSVPGLELPKYHRQVMETQLNAMNLELECLKLRLEDIRNDYKTGSVPSCG